MFLILLEGLGEERSQPPPSYGKERKSLPLQIKIASSFPLHCNTRDDTSFGKIRINKRKDKLRPIPVIPKFLVFQ